MSASTVPQGSAPLARLAAFHLTRDIRLWPRLALAGLLLIAALALLPCTRAELYGDAGPAPAEPENVRPTVVRCEVLAPRESGGISRCIVETRPTHEI